MTECSTEELQNLQPYLVSV